METNQLVDGGAGLEEVGHAAGGDDLQHRLPGKGFVHSGEHIADENFDFLAGIQAAGLHPGGKGIVVHILVKVLSGFITGAIPLEKGGIAAA